ncbi:SPFH domain-containing protein, partial [Gilvimarinus sp. SDUM040013]|uniref:SPFH domain-containing protein n=1 Tax=Gilvimarinus gilvus TaxID=3058038 RepID=UPI002672CA08
MDTIGQLIENLFIVPVALLIFALVLLKSSIIFVPQNRAYVIERFGKFRSTKEAGLNFLIPFIDRISANRSLKEQAVDVPQQGAITKDNISL